MSRAAVAIAVLLSQPALLRAAEVAVQPEEPDGYRANPSTLMKPLRQDLTSLDLHAAGDGKYDLRLGPGEGAPEVKGLDLRAFVPRIPEMARGDEKLARLALFQREFNRVDTRLGPVAGADEMKLANNCLKQGLWEVILERKNESGASAMQYHGWFEFPAEEYERLFEQANGIRYARYREMMARYPEMGGLAVPIKRLRKVEREARGGEIDLHAGEDVQRLPEQGRKAKLLLGPEPRTYGDFADPSRQPIATASFSEPGYYNPEAPVKFDLAWLGKPAGVTWRRVRATSGGAELGEVEFRFANGWRLIAGDRGLLDLKPGAVPAKESEVLRLTFGIGTPDIYATLAERMAELSAPRPNYLLLIDGRGRLVDNHTAGLDRLYLWRDAADQGALHVWLVGYERIALVAHLSTPWVLPSLPVETVRRAALE